MKVQYFNDTDTLYVEFIEDEITESRDLDENTILDLNAQGSVCALTLEHASERADLRRLVIEGLAA